MIIGRWYIRVGRNIGLPTYLDGARYAPLLAYIRDGKLYYGKGGTLNVGPFMVWWVHSFFIVRLDIK